MSSGAGLGGAAAAWTAPAVADRIEQAMDTLRRLPGERPRGYRTLWPEIVTRAVEAYGYHAPRLRLPPPSSRRIDEALEVLDWMLWLKPDQIRLVLARGQRTPWRALEVRFRRSRSTLHRWWVTALLTIVHRLGRAGARDRPARS